MPGEYLYRDIQDKRDVQDIFGKAGIQQGDELGMCWIPAFAGMTGIKPSIGDCPVKRKGAGCRLQWFELR